jgi:hypothetical protein
MGMTSGTDLNYLMRGTGLYRKGLRYHLYVEHHNFYFLFNSFKVLLLGVLHAKDSSRHGPNSLRNRVN